MAAIRSLRTLRPGVPGRAERMRCPRAWPYTMLPGGLGIMSAGIMTGVRGARWTGTGEGG